MHRFTNLALLVQVVVLVLLLGLLLGLLPGGRDALDALDYEAD